MRSSFVNIGIYWNNHHHMMQAAQRIDGRVLWANHGLLVLAFARSAGDPLDRPDGNAAVAGRIFRLGPAHGAAAAYQLILSGACCGRRAGVDRAEAVGGAHQGMDQHHRAIVAAIGAGMGFAVHFDRHLCCVAATWLVPDRRFEKGSKLHDHAAPQLLHRRRDRDHHHHHGARAAGAARAGAWPALRPCPSCSPPMRSRS